MKTALLSLALLSAGCAATAPADPPAGALLRFASAFGELYQEPKDSPRRGELERRLDDAHVDLTMEMMQRDGASKELQDSFAEGMRILQARQRERAATSPATAPTTAASKPTNPAAERP